MWPGSRKGQDPGLKRQKITLSRIQVNVLVLANCGKKVLKENSSKAIIIINI